MNILIYNVLNVFYDLIADMISNKKPNLTVTQLLIIGKKTKYFYCSYH